jgi:hypothetical protein
MCIMVCITPSICVYNPLYLHTLYSTCSEEAFEDVMKHQNGILSAVYSGIPNVYYVLCIMHYALCMMYDV